jgi:hypothetical protein
MSVSALLQVRAETLGPTAASCSSVRLRTTSLLVRPSVYGVFKGAVTNSEYTASKDRMIANNKLVGMRTEAVVA